MEPAAIDASRQTNVNLQAKRRRGLAEQERLIIDSPFEQTSEKSISFAAFVKLKLNSM
jgi:hypothetical protein